MKAISMLVIGLSFLGAAIAQPDLDLQLVPAEEVPQAVKDAQAKYFPDLTVNRWEQQTAKVSGRSITRYVASCRGGDSQIIRARYLKNGIGISASTFYVSEAQFPSEIQEKMAQKYPKHSLGIGQKVELLATGRTIYRIRLRNGLRDRIVLHLNGKGEEISKDHLPADVLKEFAPIKDRGIFIN